MVFDGKYKHYFGNGKRKGKKKDCCYLSGFILPDS